MGGPFSGASQTYLLTNSGAVSLNWRFGSTASWTSAPSTAGALAPGASASVTVGLNSSASNFLLGDYSATIYFTNLQDGTVQSWPATFDVGNGGFETGDFSDWIFAGNTNASLVVNVDDSDFGAHPFSQINYSQLVHSGFSAAELGQFGSLATLSQTFHLNRTNACLLSFWLANFPNFALTNNQTIPNEFRVRWNGATLFDKTNLLAFGMSNMQFVVTAPTGTATLEFAARHDPAAFALDDVTLQVISTPSFLSVGVTNGTVSFNFNATAGLHYQLQAATNLAVPNWTNVGVPVQAQTNFVAATDKTGPSTQRFYRFVVTP
jgi:hypothetical protein